MTWVNRMSPRWPAAHGGQSGAEFGSITLAEGEGEDLAEGRVLNYLMSEHSGAHKIQMI